MELLASVAYKVTKSEKNYSFAFSYIKKDFVKVVIIQDKVRTSLVYPVDYSIEKNNVVLKTAPKVDTIISIYRETPTTKILNWEDGSVLLASEMNIADLQTLHILEEQRDRVESTIKTVEDFIKDVEGGLTDDLNKRLEDAESQLMTKTTRKSVFTVSSSFTVPADVKRIYVSACGAGAGGTATAGGNAGASLFYEAYDVTPKASLSITVGAGGTTASTAGGRTSIGSVTSLSGGSGTTGEAQGADSLYGHGGRSGKDAVGYGAGGGAGANGMNGIVVIEW